MAAVSVRRLDDEVKERLRVRAAENGRSLEAEIRAILTAAVEQDDAHLGHALLTTFSESEGVELELPRRRERPRPATLE